MVCPKCGSNNVNVSMVNSTIHAKKPGLIARLGRLFLIICTCGLWLLIPKLGGHGKIKSKTMAVCQACGNSWKV